MNTQIKERPILFNSEMVRAILEGRKTMIRHVVKNAPTTKINHRLITCENGWNWQVDEEGIQSTLHRDFNSLIQCPYGKVGDRLWGRESFYVWGYWKTRYNLKKRRDEWNFVDLTIKCGEKYHFADNTPKIVLSRKDSRVGWWKRPSIHMPRWASRINLEITAIRIERLNEITRGDSMLEGCPFQNIAKETDPLQWFRDLWQSINGEESWNTNPWVWVVEFRRVD